MSDWTVPFEGLDLPARRDGAADQDIFVLAHSAGGRMDDPLRTKLTDMLQAVGLSVVRFNFPYRVQRRSMPDRMPRLVAAYAAVVASLGPMVPGQKLILGGHSMGGRVASMLAAEGYACDGLILFGYPLHPAGQFHKLRDAHLPAIEVPTLCINGTRDDLCRRDLMEEVLSKVGPMFRMHWIDEADHGLRLPRAANASREALPEVGRAIDEWLQILNLARPRPEAAIPG